MILLLLTWSTGCISMDTEQLGDTNLPTVVSSYVADVVSVEVASKGD